MMHYLACFYSEELGTWKIHQIDESFLPNEVDSYQKAKEYIEEYHTPRNYELRHLSEVIDQDE